VHRTFQSPLRHLVRACRGTPFGFLPIHTGHLNKGAATEARLSLQTLGTPAYPPITAWSKRGAAPDRQLEQHAPAKERWLGSSPAPRTQTTSPSPLRGAPGTKQTTNTGVAQQGPPTTNRAWKPFWQRTGRRWQGDNRAEKREPPNARGKGSLAPRRPPLGLTSIGRTTNQWAHARRCRSRLDPEGQGTRSLQILALCPKDTKIPKRGSRKDFPDESKF